MSSRPSIKRFPARCRESILSEVSNSIPFDDSGNDPLLADEGIDDPTRESVLLGTAGYILATEFCERLTYFGECCAGSIP